MYESEEEIGRVAIPGGCMLNFIDASVDLSTLVTKINAAITF